MALVKITLKEGINTDIQTKLAPLIETKTQVAFEKGLLEFQAKLKDNTNVTISNVNEAIKSASVVFSTEMKKLAEDIAKTVSESVSDNVDTYIKAGVVNVTVTGVTVGAPSPHVITAQPGIGTIA
jgi:flagellar biosynthesis/type III secretory pathway protein FliH